MKDRLVFPRVHAEVLFKIATKGAIAGLNFYMENKHLYDRLPKEVKGEFKNPQLARKLEVITAVEEKENLSGISIQSKSAVVSNLNIAASSQRRRILTEDCVDYVIEAYQMGLRISKDRVYVVVRNPSKVA